MTALIGLSAACAGHGAEPSRGAVLAAACEGCHGAAADGPGSIPAIAGQPAASIRAALEDFRSGKRASTVMGRLAKGYSDDDISLLAKYFAALD